MRERKRERERGREREREGKREEERKSETKKETGEQRDWRERETEITNQGGKDRPWLTEDKNDDEKKIVMRQMCMKISQNLKFISYICRFNNPIYLMIMQHI